MEVLRQGVGLHYVVHYLVYPVSSPYLLVFDNDRVTCYTREDDVSDVTGNM